MSGMGMKLQMQSLGEKCWLGDKGTPAEGPIPRQSAGGSHTVPDAQMAGASPNQGTEDGPVPCVLGESATNALNPGKIKPILEINHSPNPHNEKSESGAPDHTQIKLLGCQEVVK